MQRLTLAATAGFCRISVHLSGPEAADASMCVSVAVADAAAVAIAKQYLQRRGFDCVNMTSSEVVTNNYCDGPKPVLGEVECSQPAEVDCSSGDPVQPTAPVLSAAAPQPDASSPVTAVLQQQPVAATSSASSTNSSSSSGDANAPQQYNVAAVAMDGASGGETGSSSEAAGSSTAAADGGKSPAAGSSGSSLGGDTGLPLDIDSSSSGTGEPGSSAQDADAGGASGSAEATGSATTPVGSGGSAGSSSTTVRDLGPGDGLPEWLLHDPTPALKTAMDCTGGYALSADGKCCAGAAEQAVLFSPFGSLASCRAACST